MLQYLDTSIVNAFRQIVGGFGLIFVLAFLMWTMSQRRRGIGGGWLGNTYYYLVAPGVMFHELGHALGCWLTLTPVKRMALFWPKGDRLGYVAYAMPVNARFAAIRIFIISTGPVWLGCAVLALMGRIVAGSDFWSGYAQTFPSGHPGLIEYLRGVVLAAVHMAMQVVCVWKWTSPLYLILLYLLFCITSEITLSPTDLAGMWRGVFILVFFIILLNLIPGVNWVAFKLSDWLAPALFVIHSVLVFVLLIDAAFYVVFRVLRKIF